MSFKALSQYKSVDLEASVKTASPHQLITMLFDGALGSAARAKGCVERGDIEGRSRLINKSTDIIVNLRAMLDHENGGEISENYDRLYEYLIRRLFEANKLNSIEILDEVISLLTELKEGWATIPPDKRKQSS